MTQDRVNIGNAHLSFDKNLGFSENTYSLGVSIFFLTYVIFEIPSNIILKMASPPRWIARIMVSWGICSLCMMFVTNATGFILCRLFLGMCEAGFFPGMVFYLSLWFTPKERAYRLGLLFSASAVAGMVGGALAYGIFTMEGVAGLHGWQWLFLFEGIPSVIMGIIVWFTLPASPYHVSWLNNDEKRAIVLRLANYGQEKTRHKVSWSQIKAIIKDYRVWLMCIVNMCILTQVYSIAFFLPAIIAGFGFSTANANGLTTPIYLVALIAILGNSHHSDHQQERAWHIIIPSFINVIFWILLGFSMQPSGYTTVPSIHNSTLSTEQPYYNLAYQYSTAVITVSCTYSVVVILVIWVTDLFKGGSQLAVGSAIVVGFGGCGGFIGPLIVGSVNTATGTYIQCAWIMAGFSFVVMLGSLILWLLRKHVPKSDLVLDLATGDETDTKKTKEPLKGWKKLMHQVFVG